MSTPEISTACTARATRLHEAVNPTVPARTGRGWLTMAAAPRNARTERDEWLTIDEVCTELKISRRSFDRWRALGTGPKVKHLAGNGSIRIRRSWLNEWLEAPDQDIA